MFVSGSVLFVFPTGVGMDRLRGRLCRYRKGVPHGRGDGLASDKLPYRLQVSLGQSRETAFDHILPRMSLNGPPPSTGHRSRPSESRSQARQELAHELGLTAAGLVALEAVWRDFRAWTDRNDWLILDTETTGLDPASAEIVELTVIAASGGPIIDTLLRPAGKIPAETVEIHGITEDLVARAPSWPEIYPTLCRHLAGRSVLAYNAAFDAAMIGSTCRRYGLQAPAVEWVCVMEMTKPFCAALARRRPRWLSLGQLARWLRLETSTRHRALDDCALLHRVLHSENLLQSS